MVARAIPFSSTSPIFSVAPLRPITSTIVANNILVGREKSTFCSTKIRRPEAAITPNSRRDTPPITGVGIYAIIAENLPENESRIAKIAAPPMTKIEYTRVSAMTPMFSPYVVFGVDPTKPDSTVDIPLPSRERCRPGSLDKSRPTMLLVTSRCPICSTMTTSATGIIVIIADMFHCGVVTVGVVNQGAAAILAVFTSPRK
ncbi:hypothetical protein D3C77_475670 [compost metagenome]